MGSTRNPCRPSAASAAAREPAAVRLSPMPAGKGAGGAETTTPSRRINTRCGARVVLWFSACTREKTAPTSQATSSVPSVWLSSKCARIGNEHASTPTPAVGSSRQASPGESRTAGAARTRRPSHSCWLAAIARPLASATTARFKCCSSRTRATRNEEIRPSMSPCNTSCIRSRVVHDSASRYRKSSSWSSAERLRAAPSSNRRPRLVSSASRPFEYATAPSRATDPTGSASSGTRSFVRSCTVQL